MATIDKFVEDKKGISCTFDDGVTIALRTNDLGLKYISSSPFAPLKADRPALTCADVLYYTPPVPYTEDASRADRFHAIVKRVRDAGVACGWGVDMAAGQIGFAVFRLPAAPFDPQTQYRLPSFLSGNVTGDGIFCGRTGDSDFSKEFMRQYSTKGALPREAPDNLLDLLKNPESNNPYLTDRNDAGPAA